MLLHSATESTTEHEASKLKEEKNVFIANTKWWFHPMIHLKKTFEMLLMERHILKESTPIGVFQHLESPTFSTISFMFTTIFIHLLNQMLLLSNHFHTCLILFWLWYVHSKAARFAGVKLNVKADQKAKRGDVCLDQTETLHLFNGKLIEQIHTFTLNFGLNPVQVVQYCSIAQHEKM